jgi:hypothetical protein
MIFSSLSVVTKETLTHGRQRAASSDDDYVMAVETDTTKPNYATCNHAWLAICVKYSSLKIRNVFICVELDDRICGLVVRVPSC